MRMFRQLFLVAMALSATTIFARAETVRFETSLGDFDIQLFEEDAPKTVTNFMNYVNDGDYRGSIFHRSVPGFVVQGGGFMSDFSSIESDGPVENEFSRSNVRGTIAMAKLGGDPDSATNQWFINVGDNSSNLDNQNGGFTVFGEIVGDGMSIVDDIADLERFSFASPFGELPLVNYDSADFPALPPTDNLVMINDIRVVPEPSSFLLMIGLGLGMLARSRMR